MSFSNGSFIVAHSKFLSVGFREVTLGFLSFFVGSTFRDIKYFPGIKFRIKKTPKYKEIGVKA